jgi:hypothetical protein
MFYVNNSNSCDPSGLILLVVFTAVSYETCFLGGFIIFVMQSSLWALYVWKYFKNWFVNVFPWRLCERPKETSKPGSL